MEQHRLKKVLVVGAGPVGLLTALMLGQKGIPVEILEASHQINDSPRGLAYGPPATRVLRRAALLDQVLEQGFVPQDIAWRKPGGEYIVGLQGLDSLDTSLDPTIVLPVGSLSTLLLKEVNKVPCITIYWQHKVKSVGQDSEQAWVMVEHEGTTKQMIADFVVGCDGASSGVRAALFDGRFPGYTWPRQLIALNIYFDFEKHGWSDCQWVLHPEHWFLAAKVTKEGMWRISYGDPLGLSLDEIKARVAENLRIRLPGHPEPDEYNVTLVAPFSIHQRCAEKMRVGRFLLAGDAAHLCNTMGGLGLTTGVSDVGSLIDCLVGIDSGEASIDILDLYDTMRRKIFLEVTHETSTTNLLRIAQPADDVIGKDHLFHLLYLAKTDKEVAKQLLRHDLSIGCDLTQFYKPKVPDSLKDGYRPKLPEPSAFSDKESLPAILSTSL